MMLTFRGYTGTLKFSTYRSGQTRMDLIGFTEGPIATCTVALVDQPPAEGCVWIKDYSENEGMLEMLEKAGVVQRTGRVTVSGYVTIPEAKLLIRKE